MCVSRMYKSIWLEVNNILAVTLKLLKKILATFLPTAGGMLF